MTGAAMTMPRWRRNTAESWRSALRQEIGTTAMFTLYSMQRSGNSYKTRLALAQLQVPYRLV